LRHAFRFRAWRMFFFRDALDSPALPENHYMNHYMTGFEPKKLRNEINRLRVHGRNPLERTIND
jgi:hypothetical protein